MMMIYTPFSRREDRRPFSGTTHRIPRYTTLPLAGADAVVTALVDDENVRLAAELELGGLVPDYRRLAGVCTASFRTADLHVFTACSADDQPVRAARVERAEIHVHRKRVDGKNVDMEVALWLARALYGAGRNRPTHVLFVTGDVDYLTLAAAASERGAEIGFLAAPGRSLAHALRAVPHGLLGLDILGPPSGAGRARRSGHPVVIRDHGWRPPSPRGRRTPCALDGGPA